MSGERIVAVGTVKTLEASGASIANAAVAQANDASYDIVADGGGYADAQFVLSGAFSVAPAEGGLLVLMAQPLDVDGTADTETPELARPTERIGAFVVNNVTTTQTMRLFARNLPLKADYWIGNRDTGQTLSSGWTLKVTPMSEGAAA